MVSAKIPLLKYITLGTLALFVAVLAGYVFKALADMKEDPPYACEGDCVSVRFQVKIPKMSNATVFVAGNFNNWKRADKTLQLSRNPDATFWIDVDLPVDTPIKYRYSVGATIGYWEEHQEDRYIHPVAGMVRQDTVSSFGSQQYDNAPFSLYEMGTEQWAFLKRITKDKNFQSNTIEGVDSLMAWAAQRWDEESRLYYPDYNFMISGSYLSLMLNHAKDFQTSEATSCYVQSRYALPAYMKELERLTSRMDAEDTYVLSRGISALGPVYCYGLSDTTWQHVNDLYTRLPELLAHFHKMEGSPWRTTMVRETDRIKTYTPDVEFQRSVRSGKLDAARVQLAEAIQDTARVSLSLGWQKARIFQMTRTLVDFQIDQGQADKAEETLQFVARETSGFLVPDDSLATWYRRLPETYDGQGFEMQLASMGRAVLRGEGEPVLFAGEYRNLTDSTTFDLAGLNGKTVVLDFWGMSCPPCIAEIPDFVAFQNRIADRNDMIFVSVAEDALDLGGFITPDSETGQRKIANMQQSLEGIAKNKGINYILLYDDPANPISKNFRVDYFPTKYIIDNTGRIVSQIQSVNDVPL